MPDPGKPSGKPGVSGHISNGTFALNVGEALVEHRYGDAATAVGFKVAFNPKVYEAAATLTKSVAPVAKAAGWIGRNLPLIGGIVMAVYDAKEVYDDIKKGEYKKALVAGVAGVAEVAATTALGGLAGAGARTLIVEGVAAAGGPRANDAMLVAVGKEAVKLGVKAYDQGSKFLHDMHDPAKIAAEQVADLHKEGVLPKTVKLEGKEVGLEVALRNPTFNKAFRQNLVDAQKHGHLDAKPLLATIDKFDALEKERVAHGGNHAPATQTASAKPAAHAHAPA
jgi:hypothetical protein